VKLKILSPEDWAAFTAPFDRYIPDEQATDAFWSALDTGRETLRQHLSGFGEEYVAWELPGHSQQCRVLYIYLYSDALYTPDLLPGIAAAIPQDGEPWCVELECYTDTRTAGNGGPLTIGWAAIVGDTVYTSSKYTDFHAYAARLQLQIA
jgi:hypothetical protein